jgi:hypothetical protein
MMKTLLKEFVREIEFELVKEAQMEMRVQEAWAAYARKVEAGVMKLAV